MVKPTHGSGHVLRVHDRTIDLAAAREALRGWLAFSHGAVLNEPGYIHVPRRIIAERMILNHDGFPPLERRMFVFNGRVQLTQTDHGRKQYAARSGVSRSRLAAPALARRQ